MAKSLYLRNKALNDYLKAGNKYLALFANNPEAGGAEVAGGGYSRKQISLGNVANGQVANNAAISLVNMPASNIMWWAIMDASTGGNILYLQRLGTNIVLAAGNPFNVAIGDLVITED